jgi:cyclohexa-1,5-dienecarbonyl-CoA hydratase
MADQVRRDVADGIATLTLVHPPVNVLTREVLAQYRAHLADLAAIPGLRVLVLRAEGKHFSAGADVAEHLPPTVEDLIREFIATIGMLWNFPLPVVAAVRGRCLGGGFELVQPADVIVAGESAAFGQPEILLGVMPPAACALLPRLCGPARAALITLGGDPLDARAALAAGLVSAVVPDARVEEEALGLAARFARHSAAALTITKRALRAATDRTAVDAMAEAEHLYLSDLMATRDASEGIRAFLEKRPAIWEHR